MYAFETPGQVDQHASWDLKVLTARVAFEASKYSGSSAGLSCEDHRGHPNSCIPLIEVLALPIFTKTSSPCFVDHNSRKSFKGDGHERADGIRLAIAQTCGRPTRKRFPRHWRCPRQWGWELGSSRRSRPQHLEPACALGAPSTSASLCLVEKIATIRLHTRILYKLHPQVMQLSYLR